LTKWHDFNTKRAIWSRLVTIDFGAEKGERVSEGRQGGERTIGIGGKVKLYEGLGYVKAIGGGLLPWER
jgi:hypothetical protein